MGKKKLPIRTVLRQVVEHEKTKFKSFKRPSWQVYPGDLKKDPGYQALDLEHKGAWWELMLTMVESEQKGRLTLNGTSMPDEAVARILGVPIEKAQSIVEKLLTYGVASIDPKTNILYCRRMVRDQKLSDIRKFCGHLGGNPALLQDKKVKEIDNLLNHGVKATSSSSSSTSKEEDTKVSSSSPLPPTETQTLLTDKKMYEIWNAECAPLQPVEAEDLEGVRPLRDHFNTHAKNGRGPEEYWKEFVHKCREVHPDYRIYLDPIFFAKDKSKINKLLRGVYNRSLSDGEKQSGGTKGSKQPGKGSPEHFKGENISGFHPSRR